MESFAKELRGVTKRQKTGITKTIDAIDGLLARLRDADGSSATSASSASAPNPRPSSTVEDIKNEHKVLHSLIGKLGVAAVSATESSRPDHSILADYSFTGKDERTGLEVAVLDHLIRRGYFDGADALVAEGTRPPNHYSTSAIGTGNLTFDGLLRELESGRRPPPPSPLSDVFREMFSTTQSIRRGEVSSALAWLSEHAPELPSGWAADTQVALHALRFMHLLQGRVFVQVYGTGAAPGERPSAAGEPNHHRWQFVLVHDPSACVHLALAYGREHFPALAHHPTIKRLMAAALFAYTPAAGEDASVTAMQASRPAEVIPDLDSDAVNGITSGRLAASPYRDLLPAAAGTGASPAESAFLNARCSLLGLPTQSPLEQVWVAGAHAEPVLLKYSSMCTATGGRYPRPGMAATDTAGGSSSTPSSSSSSASPAQSGPAEVAVELPLPSAFQFHSIFACPVTRQACGRDNPPMLLPCGHVVSKASMDRLASIRPRFKCPTCPSLQTLSQAVTIAME